MTNIDLINAAAKSLRNSYSPYSGFKVGAALLCASGQIFCGCNIENASYSAGICAERTAIFKAVSEGEHEFVKLALVGGKDGKISDFCYPCGICRQVISEFCGADFIIVTFDGKKIRTHTLGELLPLSFGRKNLCE